MSECDRGVCELDSLPLVVLLWVLVAWHGRQARVLTSSQNSEMSNGQSQGAPGQCRNRYLDGTEILLIPISKKY